MVKVGDTVMFKNEEYSVINIHTPIFHSRNEVAHLLLENRNNTVVLPLTAYYKQLHEQQKQRADEFEHDLKIYKDLSAGWKISCFNNEKRADEYEKRWNELKEYLNNNGNLYLVELTRVEVLRKMNELEDSE